MEDNLKLWRSVEKTNPNYTKNANVKGNNITSIAPQFQILNATEKFGVYGISWGFKSIEIDYTLVPVNGLVFWKAIFFFPNGEFPATNSISIWRDNAMTKADDQFAKKVETDSLTKCLSKLGFNADIFLGKFDDDKYLKEVTEEFLEKPKIPTKESVSKVINEAESIDTLTEWKGWISKFKLGDLAAKKAKALKKTINEKDFKDFAEKSIDFIKKNSKYYLFTEAQQKIIDLKLSIE